SRERRFDSFAKSFAKPFRKSRVNVLRTVVGAENAIRRTICETVSRGEGVQIARSALYLALYWRIPSASVPF
ncbi:MAG: hypothetical protein MJE77_22945, partial [Proteobacteria bacterium]|nr:hypothetical protein [Pseudomonadota bacterium]